MTNPFSRMIEQAVRCLTCGAGYGKCDCAAKNRAKDAAELQYKIDAEYDRLMLLSDEDLIAECESLGVKIPTR